MRECLNVLFFQNISSLLDHIITKYGGQKVVEKGENVF